MSAETLKEFKKGDILCPERICPICHSGTHAPYGAVSDKAACCSKPCSLQWDALPFEKKQECLEHLHVKLHIVTQAA